MALEFSFVNIPLFSLICLAYVAPLSFHQNDSLPCSLHSIVLAVYVTFLLLLRRFSRVRLCATPQMAAHQAPLSPGFSRQEHWSGLPFPSPLSYLSLFSQLEMLFFQLLQIADSHCIWYIRKKKENQGTSLVVQWLRLRLSMQGVRVRSQIGKPRSHMPCNKRTKNIKTEAIL